MKYIEVEPRTDELIRINSFLEDELSLKQYDIKLIVEEIFINIVNYSKCNYVKIYFELQNDKLKMIFADDGIPFNPLEKEKTDFPDDIEDMQIGGLGIHLVKSMAEELSYEYKDNENHLTVYKGVLDE